MNASQSTKQSFARHLAKVAAQQLYVKVQYYSDIHELLKVNSVVKGITSRAGIDYLELASGEEIKIENLVQVGTVLAPGHAADDGFSCAC